MLIAKRFLLLIAIPALLLTAFGAAAWWRLAALDVREAVIAPAPPLAEGTAPEQTATRARDTAMRELRIARDLLPFVFATFAVVFVTVVALLWRQLIAPIRTLESAVALISGGTFALRVPHTQRRDEIGSIARSIDALRLASVAIENERWIKNRAARIGAAIQRAPTLETFGAVLLSELLPEIGGGAGALSVTDAPIGALRRVVAYGVAPDSPAPVERVAWRLESGDERLLGVIDLAPERFINERERALLVTLMPVAAIALELLQLRAAAFPPPRLPA